MRLYVKMIVKSPADFVIESFIIVDDESRQMFTNADVGVLLRDTHSYNLTPEISAPAI